MATERLIGNATINQSGSVGGTAHNTGWDWSTNLTGQVVKQLWVRMPDDGGSGLPVVFSLGTKAQLWEKKSPISTSTLLKNIEIGGGVVTGLTGTWQPVPGSGGDPVGQNVHHFATIYFPSTATTNYWFKSGFGDPTVPPNVSMSGSCIFKDGGAATAPPDDPTFSNGAFGVDVEIEDAASDINCTLTLVLPALTAAFAASAIASASLALTLPPVGLSLTGSAIASGSLSLTLPAPSLALSGSAIVSSALGLVLPVPALSLDATAPIGATLGLVLPVPRISLVNLSGELSANLREYVWTLLKNDPDLNALGINSSSLFGTNAPDSPSKSLQNWAILHWASEEPPLGRDTSSRRRLLQVWAYDRNRDYSVINPILDRARALLYPLTAVQYASYGWITEVTDGGYSEDLFDPAYDAATRSWSSTIVASGY